VPRGKPEMIDSRLMIRGLTLAVVICATTAMSSCTRSAPPSAQVDGADLSQLELDCERRLAVLDDTISKRRSDGTVTVVRLIEASELHATASELYLNAEYELALLFIDEAFSLLGN
jgi:hypothetical protein